MPLKSLLAGVLILGTCAFTRAAGTDELKGRRQRAADAFSDGILLLHARASADDAADGFRQEPMFFYFTGLENTVGAMLAIDGRSHESWLFLPTAPPGSRSAPTEGTAGSSAVKHAGVEHVAEWSELEGFLAGKGGSALPLYYLGLLYSVPDLPPNLMAANTPRAPRRYRSDGQSFSCRKLARGSSYC